MAYIPSVVSESQLQLEYNFAKIKADPYNYTLTDRVLFYDRGTCYHKYNIFEKMCLTEISLCEMLGLKYDKYLYIDCPIGIVGTGDIHNHILVDFMDYILKNNGYMGEFIKYNNLIVNEESLIESIRYSTAGTRLDIAKNIVSKGYLKALEFLFTKCISKSSLIPNLMYIPTNFKNYNLEDLENITFAKEAMAKKIAPIICTVSCNTLDLDCLNVDYLIGSVAVPSINEYPFAAHKNLGNDIYRMGLSYAIIYGAEILYYFNQISDEDIKMALEELFSISYKDKGFCEKYLYSINDLGHVEINKKILDCFDDDNVVRFSKIKNYFDSICININTDIISDFKEFRIPVIFAKFLQSMHGYAFQIARVKHAILLYKEAKSQGVLDETTFRETISSGGSSLFGGGKDAEPLNELMNLGSLVDNSPEMTDEEFLEHEKNIEDITKAKPPILNTMDALQKDLYDSMYEFDIKYVKNDNSNKDSYYKIANSISMITHNLAKQIKEIRTYNTGGKQNGLLTGKLDKKNLYRYKSDPKIFYNNNYKIKEMDLAFGCILDESGSMYGEKIKNGRIVMIMLHEVLNSLGINHGIIGHSGNERYQSTIYKYFQFKEEPYYSLEKPYNLVTAKARSCNCDSGALYYMQKVMKRVQNKDKIVIIFSDGQPTECTELDLTNQVKAMEKEGIHVIGVGINFDSIKDYYPDNANGKNLKEMVDIIISILKRYVLEKKED